MLPQTSCAPTTPNSTHNITVTVPEGTQSHGSPNLLCTPTRWTDVAIFFLANYVAHAATIKSVPGEPPLAAFRVHVAALLFPLAGVLRGVRAIRQCAILCDTPLETAAKAEALCVVIRTPKWLPQEGDVACVGEIRPFDRTRSSAQSRNDREEFEERLSFRIEANERSFLPFDSSSEIERRKVHGICRLPHGYALAILPPRAPITELCRDKRNEIEMPTLRHPKDGRRAVEDRTEPRVPGSQDDNPSNPDICPEVELSSNYNLPKGLIAIFQTLYASATLYQTRGDQIQRYGYAAFGLTVTPYLIMSIVNLLSTVLTPDYPCLYLVRSEIMDEAARREGAKFEGIVATLGSDTRKVWHYVEFTIDENDRMFIRSSRESITQRGPRDATDVVQREITSPDATPPEIAFNLGRHFRAIILKSPGFSDDLPLRTSLDRFTHFAGLVIGLSPIAINGGLSHFSSGHSTHAQRVWTMSWLAFGWCIGLFFELDVSYELLTSAFFSAPAIGGFVVVAQMLTSYGRCVEID